MPQHGMRSVVYRSLVTCSDPNGVVEYKTIRKSKSSPHKAEEGSNRSSQGVKQESHVPIPSPILEVSRGSHKLNFMIDSWSERLSFDGQSKDIARDLLKGALDLQESLVMLRKLQEPPKCSGQMKQRHNNKYQGGIHGLGVETNDSDGLAQKSESSRLSLDGSSKNSGEELKKVIRDSLTRQNLLSNSIIEEKVDSFCPRKSGNFSDIPSTRSSQSSVVNSNNSASMDWSFSSISKEVKAKNPSLIAKLMGLEGFPTETSPLHLKQQESKNRLDHERLIHDIEMQIARKAYSSSHERNPERKTLKEVIDAMSLEGLLESNNVQGLVQNRRTSYDLSLKQDDNELPPIVVIKPVRLPFKDKEESLQRNCNHDSLYKYQKFESREESSTRRSHHVEGAPHFMEMHNKQKVKEELWNGKEGLTIKKISEKAQKIKEISVKRNSQEQVSSSSKEKGENIKRTDRVKKGIPNRKAPEDMENAKSDTMLRAADHVRPNSTKASKRDSGPTMTKNLIQRQETLTHKPILVRSIQSKSADFSGQVKNISTRKAKPSTESTKTSSLTKRLRPKHGERERSHTNKMAFVLTMTSSDLENQLCAAESKEPSVQIEDLGEQENSSLCEVPSQHGSSIVSAEELEHFVDHNIKIEETVQSEIIQSELLLSSPSFLSFAEDNFELHINQQTVLKPPVMLEAVDMTNTRLFLDCAKELMECKSRRIMLGDYPLFWIPAVNVGTRIYPEQLLGEVYDGFEKLKNYIKVDDDIPAKDAIGKMLESDIMCKRPLTGDLWDMGWVFGFSVNDIDQVLSELQEQVLNQLIEEITVDCS